jgi:hypothetical protein
MMSFFRDFLNRHSVLRQALWWALPAVFVGLFVRALLLSYLPYAAWGADSRSHFSFAHQLIVRHGISLDEKRRYLAPLLLLPVAFLPGAALRWVAFLQHALGVISLVPLAYAIRRNLVAWRVWVIPLTVVYALFPITILFEHQLAGECLFFNSFLWAFAGWAAWVEPRDSEVTGRFWYFFVPFAAFSLTKASARFAWPGLALAIALAMWERRLKLKRGQAAALAMLAGVTLTVGSKRQGSWILYTAVFPLTQLDTPKHAEYKAEIRDLVLPLRSQLDTYYLRDSEPFTFLFHPGRDASRPHWVALQEDTKRRYPLYLDLALEGIRARPGAFLHFGVQRTIASANASLVRLESFSPTHFATRSERYYAEAECSELSPLRLAFGVPRHGPIPSFDEFKPRLTPRPDSWASRTFQAIVGRTAYWVNLVKLPGGPLETRHISRARPTLLGGFVMLGFVLALLPRYRGSLGAWGLLSLSYLYGVFVFSEVNYRYFAPVWPVLFLLAVLPADWAVTRLLRRQHCAVGAPVSPARPVSFLCHRLSLPSSCPA